MRTTSPTTETFSLTQIDICGAESCSGHPWSLVCTLSVNHDGMHHQDGVPCFWELPESMIRERLGV